MKIGEAENCCAWSALPIAGGGHRCTNIFAHRCTPRHYCWRTDPPCPNSISALKKKQPARQHADGVRHTSCTFQKGAPNYSVRFAYFQTNRLLIQLYKQETEIHCRKDDGYIKKYRKQTSIATVRYPILT